MPVQGDKSTKESAEENMVPVKNPIFKAEIIQYDDSDDPGSPIIASSGNDVNIIFSISKEKFRKMAMAVFDRWEQDRKDPSEELDSHSSACNGISRDEGNSEVSNDCVSDSISNSTKSKNETHSLESFTEKRVEKDQLEDYSSPDDTRCMDSKLSTKYNEELETKTDPKSPETGLEKDSKENKSDSCSSKETNFEIDQSDFRKNENICEEIKIKQCLCNETDGINKHCDNPACQKLEKNISKLNKDEIESKSVSYSKVLSEFLQSEETVEDKLNVDGNIKHYKDESRELAEKEFSDMFPAMKTEEINLTEIKSVEVDGTFTKYFKIDLSDVFVVLKVTTSDKDFLMNTFKFKVLSTDSVAHGENFREKTTFSSKCINSSDFSNEKPIATKAQSLEENAEEVLSAINEEKLENEQVYSPKNSNEMDSSNSSVANEENDVANQSTCSNSTPHSIKSLDLERSRELDEKETLECSRITLAEVESSDMTTVANSEVMDMKSKIDTKDNQSNVSYCTSKCELTIEHSSKAKDILDKESLIPLNVSNSECLNITYSLTDTMEENSLEASEKCLQTLTEEFVDTENKLHKTDINEGSTRSTHSLDAKNLFSPLEQIAESSPFGKDHSDNDSLNIKSENLKNKEAESEENALQSVAPQVNLEIKSEGCDKSFSFSFSEFVEDEKTPEEKTKNEKADLTKSVEDNVESEMSAKIVSNKNSKTDEEIKANITGDSLKDSSGGTLDQSTEITTAVYTEKTEFTYVTTETNSAETDSVAIETNLEENNQLIVSDECSEAKSENIIKDFESKRKYEEIVETETLQQSKNNLKENLPDVVGNCVENESSELTDAEMKKETIEETAEDANKTESSIDVSENDAETYEITKCVPTNDCESENTRCTDEVVGNAVAVPESVSPCKIVITQHCIDSQDQLNEDEHLEDISKDNTLSEEKLLENSSIIESETSVSRFSTASNKTVVTDKETNGEILHSETLGSSFISISETSKVDNSSFSEEPENVEDEESVADSESASERDILDNEDVKSVASESDDSKDSGSFPRAKNSKKHESEVDCAPTRVRAKRSALKLSEDVIPENSVVSKSKSFRSSNVVSSSNSKPTLKVSPASKSLRSKSLEPADKPSKSSADSSSSKSSKTDSAEANRRKRACTPEVVSKRDIKTAVRSSPRKITRASSLNTEANQSPKDKITRSNTEVATTSNSSSSSASVTKKRTKRSGAEKK